ncbi:MAG: hypothetical protein ACXWDL_03775 [Nocardioides sp.]
MQALIAGIIAVVVGGGLATLTAVGVVSSVSGSPTQPDEAVMNYGTNQSSE